MQATTEINRNHELAVSLDQGFQKVQSAVEKGNGAIQTAKSSILSMEETVDSARQIDRFAAYRDEPDHIDSRRDQFHCIPDESVVVKMHLLRRRVRENTEEGFCGGCR